MNPFDVLMWMLVVICLGLATIVWTAALVGIQSARKIKREEEAAERAAAHPTKQWGGNVN